MLYFLLLLPGLVHALTLRVPQDYPDIQTAIQQAQSNDSIHVSAGTWAPFDYLGKSLHIRSLDGAGNTWIEGDNEQLVRVQNSTSSLVGFTLSGGRALVAGNAAGAGIHADQCSLSLGDLVFISNQAILGGGLCALDCQLFMQGCQFHGNLARTGGGIYAQACELNLVGLRFTSNEASAPGYGGGMALESSSGLIHHSEFIGNHGSLGGALSIRGEPADQHLSLFNSSFSMNEAPIGSQLHLLRCTPELSQLVLAGGVTGIAVSSLAADPVCSCCITWNNQGGNALPGTDGGGNRNLDPLFCDPAIDLRLQTGSPCWSSACGTVGAWELDCEGLDHQEPMPREATVHSNPLNLRREGQWLRFRLAEPQVVEFTVFDLRGAHVLQFRSRSLAAGDQSLVFDGSRLRDKGLAEGFYILQVQSKSGVVALPFHHLN